MPELLGHVREQRREQLQEPAVRRPKRVCRGGQQQLNLITSIDYSIDYTITPSANAKQGKQHQYASKSVLAEGDWHKLQIKRS
ncbi:MAG: hypothetical protein R6V56_09375, partial [Lentisphaeria bacterium]